MIYEPISSGGRGGGPGLFRTAMSLCEQFREGGVRDQERARLAAMQQQQKLGDQQMKVNEFNLQRLPVEAGQKDAAYKATQDAASQQIKQAEHESNRKKALQSIGELPDMTPYELTPPAAEFGGWEGATGDELGSRLEQTPWADLNRAEREVVGKVPGSFSDLGPLDLSASWDNVVGANTGGARGNAPIQSSVTDGKATTTYEPRNILDAKRQSEYNQMFAKQVSDHTARLQDAFRKDRPFMVWRTADNSFRALSSQLSKNDPNGASDLAAAIGFARMLDPDSVVREGERDIVVKRSGGFFDVLKAYANQITGDGMVSAQQRKNLIEAAATEMDAYTVAANNALQDLAHQGVEVGVDPKTIASGPFVSPAEELRKSGVLSAKGDDAPPKFRTLAEAQAAGLTPGQTVLIEVPGKGFEQVTVGPDGSINSTEQPLTAAPRPTQLPQVQPDFMSMMNRGVMLPRTPPPRIDQLMDFAPELLLQYPGVVAPPDPRQPRHELIPPRR